MRVRGLILPIGGPRKRTTQEQEIIDWLAKGLWAINLALLQAHAIGYLDQEPAGFGLGPKKRKKTHPIPNRLHPAEPDIRALKRGSGFDPKRT